MRHLHALRVGFDLLGLRRHYVRRPLEDGLGAIRIRE